MVRDFQTVIGRETKGQIQALAGRLPDLLVACVGGGSNSIGLFHAFLEDRSVRMVGVEAGGKGITSGLHAARFADLSVGVLHGTKTHVLQDDAGQIRPTHSISAGLDYPAVGPEHAALHAAGRVAYESATDEEALDAFDLLARTEGILPALEPSHALAYLMRAARSNTIPGEAWIVVNLSGRGDKDLTVVLQSRRSA
jgi:tryptophan synthase beta chain